MIPLFYKSHYEVIAEKIHEEHSKGNPETQLVLDTLAFKFAVYFAEDNANFNKDKFLRACGVIEEVNNAS